MKTYGFKTIFLRLTVCSTLSALLLTGCETAVGYKPGGAALQEADRVVSETGDLDQASQSYLKALNSPVPEVASQAAYSLAEIAKENGRMKEYRYYLEQASKAGHMNASLNLAGLYEKERGKEAEIKTLYEPFTDISAGANIGLMKLAQKERRVEDAIRHARKAEEIMLQQLSSGQDSEGGKALQLARLYSDKGHYFGSSKNPETWYRKAIEKGNVRAAQELAEYWMGSGTRQNPEEDVFVLMLQAAEAGNVQAIKYVASAYETGRGVSKNSTEALAWHKKLPAGSMSASTLINLGHENFVRGQKENMQAAATYFRQAAGKGAMEAMVMLDTMYTNSKPSYMNAYRKNPDSAFSYVRKLEKRYGRGYSAMIQRQYQLAADAGSGRAAYEIAKKLESEPLEQRDPVVIAQWYQTAADKGEPKAMLILARQAKIGQGRSRNEKDAAKWFEKAAEAGNAEGQYEIGLAYANGYGVKRNKDKARYWLEKAREGGYALSAEASKVLSD